MNICILGATGHIAQNVFDCFYYDNNTVFLFGRRIETLQKIFGGYNGAILCDYGDFHKHNYDIIFNCVGLGDPSTYKDRYYEIFEVTEYYDNICMDYIKKAKTSGSEVLYVNFSTGAVYGEDFSQPVSEMSESAIRVNNYSLGDYYRIAKMNAEAKHRSAKGLRIVDLRIFGFFSRHIDLNYNFLMCDVIRCIRDNLPLITNKYNILRDYIHPQDFKSLLSKIARGPHTNTSIDVQSAKPAYKFEILEFFKERYGLKYEIKQNESFESVTGFKENYYSIRKNELEFRPEFTSLQCIADEAERILC